MAKSITAEAVSYIELERCIIETRSFDSTVAGEIRIMPLVFAENNRQLDDYQERFVEKPQASAALLSFQPTSKQEYRG